MIQLKINLQKSVKISFSIFLIFSFTILSAQDNDIWDEESTLTYARYLYNKGDFLQSAEEYQRYVFRNKDDKNAVSSWIRAYAKGNKESYALDILRNWHIETDRNFSSLYYIERSWLLIRLGYFDQHGESLLKTPEDWRYRKLHHVASIMLQEKWDLARKELKDSDIPIEKKLYQIAYNAGTDNYKSPVLAGVMSAVVPGTGKFYVGRYVDGIISIMFVGVMTFQATRFFQSQGVSSWPAWIYTGLGGLYYSANIFGSVKSAKEYNQKKVDKYKDETNRILYSIY